MSDESARIATELEGSGQRPQDTEPGPSGLGPSLGKRSVRYDFRKVKRTFRHLTPEEKHDVEAVMDRILTGELLVGDLLSRRFGLVRQVSFATATAGALIFHQGRVSIVCTSQGPDNDPWASMIVSTALGATAYTPAGPPAPPSDRITRTAGRWVAGFAAVAVGTSLWTFFVSNPSSLAQLKASGQSAFQAGLAAKSVTPLQSAQINAVEADCLAAAVYTEARRGANVTPQTALRIRHKARAEAQVTACQIALQLHLPGNVAGASCPANGHCLPASSFERRLWKASHEAALAAMAGLEATPVVIDPIYRPVPVRMVRALTEAKLTRFGRYDFYRLKGESAVVAIPIGASSQEKALVFAFQEEAQQNLGEARQEVSSGPRITKLSGEQVDR